MSQMHVVTVHPSSTSSAREPAFTKLDLLKRNPRLRVNLSLEENWHDLMLELQAIEDELASAARKTLETEEAEKEKVKAKFARYAEYSQYTKEIENVINKFVEWHTERQRVEVLRASMLKQGRQHLKDKHAEHLASMLRGKDIEIEKLKTMHAALKRAMGDAVDQGVVHQQGETIKNLMNRIEDLNRQLTDCKSGRVQTTKQSICNPYTVTTPQSTRSLLSIQCVKTS